MSGLHFHMAVGQGAEWLLLALRRISTSAVVLRQETAACVGLVPCCSRHTLKSDDTSQRAFKSCTLAVKAPLPAECIIILDCFDLKGHRNVILHGMVHLQQCLEVQKPLKGRMWHVDLTPTCPYKDKNSLNFFPLLH